MKTIFVITVRANETWIRDNCCFFFCFVLFLLFFFVVVDISNQTNLILLLPLSHLKEAVVALDWQISFVRVWILSALLHYQMEITVVILNLLKCKKGVLHYLLHHFCLIIFFLLECPKDIQSFTINKIW